MPDAPVDAGPGRSYFPDMEARVAVLEQIARSTAATLERIERRLDRMDDRFDRIDQRIDALQNRIAVESRWPPGIMLGGFTTLPGLIAHGFHWF